MTADEHVALMKFAEDCVDIKNNAIWEILEKQAATLDRLLNVVHLLSLDVKELREIHRDEISERRE